MENYKEIKNYIHNELGITKESIQQIVINTVKEEVIKVFNDESKLERIVHNYIRNIVNGDYKSPSWHRVSDINSLIYNGVIDEICKTVKEKVEVRFK